MVISTELVSIAAVFIAQVKLILDNRITKVELKNIVRRLDKQNNRLGRAEDWQMKHLERHKK